MNLDSFAARFTTKQIAIGGGVIVVVLFATSFFVLSITAWSYSADCAVKREEELAAKKKEKAIADLQQAFAGVFKVPPKKTKPIEWLTHDKEAVIGDAKITILSGDFGTIKWKQKSVFRETTEHTSEKTANVRIRVTNISKTKIIEYAPFHFDLVLRGSKIKDEHGNNCEISTLGGDETMSGYGVSAMCKINPGDSIDDTLAFKYPLPISTEFFVSIHGYVGGLPSIFDDNYVHFQIPRSFFIESK